MSGYSQTPLVKKLGIKPGFRIKTRFEPEDYWDWINPLPQDLKISKSAKPQSLDFVHLFAVNRKVFEREFNRLKSEIKKDGMLWVSWPKKSSGIQSDLDDGVIRNHGLSSGLVDVKVCAVSDVWSGLKFMYRLKDR